MIDGTPPGLAAAAQSCPAEIRGIDTDQGCWDSDVDARKPVDLLEEGVRHPWRVRWTSTAPTRSSATAGDYGLVLLHVERTTDRGKLAQAASLLDLELCQGAGGKEDMIMEIDLRLSASSAAQESLA